MSKAKKQWIVAAFGCMLGFIVFEALAVRELSKAFGYKRKFRKALVYSTSDIYFSAITPFCYRRSACISLFYDE